MRLRLRIHTYPRPALVLANSPRPHCPHCRGNGWRTEYVQDGPSPEDGERLDVPCGCWTPDYHRTLLPIPSRLYYRLWRLRHRSTGWSDESPF